MPKIVKQSRKRVTKSGVLGRIHDVGSRRSGMKLNVYGLGKRGKTRLACSFPKPLLLIGTEDGTASLGKMKGVQFVQLQRTTDLDELLPLVSDGKYESVVLDTAGGLQDMILKEILGLEDMPIQKTWGIAKQGDWQTCGSQTKERLRAFLDLAAKANAYVVIIAHERDFSKGDESDNDLGVFPTVGSALTPSVAGWLNGACDYIGQCFLQEEVTIKKRKIGKKVTESRQKTGKIEYCLRIGPHPIYMTGFRVSPDVVLPDCIVNPSYQKIQSVIDGE